MKNIIEKKYKNISKNKVLYGVLALIILVQSCIIGYILLPRYAEWIDSPRPPLGDFINVMDKGAKGNGTTDDSKAIILALNEAQEKNMDIYFPAGTYNFNNINLTAAKNVRIFGDGEASILYNPGVLYCYNDISLEKISVFKRSGVFIYLKPQAYSNVLVDSVKVYNDLEISDSCRVVYACITTSGENRGIDNVTFTNNNISKCQMGLYLKCEVKSGIINNNIMNDFGSPDKTDSIFGVVVGTVDPNNKWIQATNVTISNNTIKGLYSALNTNSVGDEVDYNVNAIQATGTNIQIFNNYIENQNSGAGIFSKANDVTISGNTLIDAGRMSSICVKRSEVESNGSDIIVENNNITSSVDHEGSIRLHATQFVVRNNKIKLYDNSEDMLSNAAAIKHSTNTVTRAVIERNEIYTESRTGILIMYLDGNVSINNNTITQNVITPVIAETTAVFTIRNASPTSVVNCSDNNITMERGLYAAYGTSNNKDGSIFNLINNTITAPVNTSYLISTYYMTCNLIKNTITMNQDPTLDESIQRKGILSEQATSVLCRIEGNNIFYGDSASNLFSLKSPFLMKDNILTFDQGSSLTSIISYAPSFNPTPGESSVISGNTVGNINEVLNGGKIANADCFILFNTHNSYEYPQMNISQNSAMINTNLLNTTSSSRIIASASKINVENNMIYSALNSTISTMSASTMGTSAMSTSAMSVATANEATASEVSTAIIASPLKQTSLVIGKNVSLADYMANQLSAADMEAAEKAAADKLAVEQAEAERLAAEKAEAESAAEEAKAEEERAAAAAAAAEAEAEAAAAAAAAAEAAAEQAASEAAAAKAAAEQAAADAAADAAAKAAEEQAAAAQEAADKAAQEAAAAEVQAAAEKAAADKAEADRIAIEMAEADRIAAETAAAEKAEADRIAAELAQLAADKAEADRIAAEAAKAADEAAAAAMKESALNLNDFIYYTNKNSYLTLQFSSDIACSSSWNKVVTIDGKSYRASKYGNNSICVDTTLSQLNKNFKVTVKNILYPNVNSTKTYTLTKTFSGGGK